MVRPGLVAILLATTGCALALNRGAVRQPLYVDTDPPGAVATTEGKSCVTPCALPVARTRDAVVTVSKEQHEPVAALFRSRLGARTLFNLFIPFPGVVIGLATDVASGAAYDLVPPAARLELRAEPPRAEPPGGGLEVPRAPPAPLELAPRGPVRFALTLGLGFGATAVSADGSSGGLLIQGSALGTARVAGPWVVGGAVDEGLKPPMLWEEPVGVSAFTVVGGFEATPTRNSRLVALLQAGTHRYSGARDETLPAIGGRVDWTAVFADGFALGGYASYLRDLGTATVSSSPLDPVEVGGDTVVLGLSLGLLVR